MSTSIYIYPIVSPELSDTKNPYINDLILSLEKTGNKVVNKYDESHIGVFSIFKYFFTADVFHFNWIEYLAKKKLGYFQLIVFLFQIFIIKLSNKKIILTLHNLNSHYSDDWSYKFIQHIMLGVSNLIIIHTKESYRFLEKKQVNKSKIFYFFHPFSEKSNNKDVDLRKVKKYDILIWGLMNPYKGIYEFLEFIKNMKLDYKIVVAGEFTDITYFNKIKEVITENVEIRNFFIDDLDLIELHFQSNYILFPYNRSSVLNSGSLAFSLGYCSTIIGPNRGAFKELGDLGIIKNFVSYVDIIKILKSDREDVDVEKREKFISDHSWNCFASELNVMLEKKRIN